MANTNDNSLTVASGDFLGFARDPKEKLKTHLMLLVAARAAFYCLLVLIPAISVALAISDLLNDPDRIVSQLHSLDGLVPQEAMDIIVTQAEAVAGLRVASLGLASLAGLALLYRHGPSRDDPVFRWVNGGAGVACVAWIAGFAVFVAPFGTYNQSLGVLAGVVILLFWFWLSTFSVLFGAEWNALVESRGTSGTNRQRTKI